MAWKMIAGIPHPVTQKDHIEKVQPGNKAEIDDKPYAEKSR